MNWLNQLLCSHKFYFRVRDEITNKNKWQCQVCGKRFHYLDNTDLPVPRLTAPVPIPPLMVVKTHYYPHILGNRAKNPFGVVTKKNLTPTEPTIYDTVMDMVEKGL